MSLTELNQANESQLVKVGRTQSNLVKVSGYGLTSSSSRKNRKE
jgi:hypothetical protein